MPNDQQGKPSRNCNICGRLMRKVVWFDDEAKVERFIRFQCVKVFSIGDEGWEHD